MTKHSLRYILAAPLLLMGMMLSAQNEELDRVLETVGENSPRLAVAARQLDLDRLESASQKILPNPELEFNYLFGQNAEVGNRKDFSFTQSFDFATLSGMRNRLSASMEDLALTAYRAETMEVLSEARTLCSDLAFSNALISEYEEYLALIQTLVELTSMREEYGEATVFDSAKAKMQLASVKASLSQARIERASLLASLRALAGVEELDFLSHEIIVNDPGADFGSWFAAVSETSPVMQYVARELAVAQASLKVEKSATVPELTFGYMSELGHSDQYRGLTMGVSIPLWSNRNRVRSASAAVELAIARKAEQEKLFLSELSALWQEADTYRKASLESRFLLESVDKRDLLLKAVQNGEISILDYIVDLESYYDILEKTLDLERNYRNAVMLLQKYEG